MNRLPLKTFAIAFIFSAFHFGAAKTLRADWPQFLGKDRNGTSSETGLLDSFPEGGPEVVWRVPGGIGMSAVAVTDQSAITMWNEGGDQLLVALDAQTGKRQWQTAVGSLYKNSMGDGPRATPTIHEGSIYTFTGDGVLSAVMEDSGKLLWQVDTAKQFKMKPSEYGLSSSPLIAGDNVIVQVGAEKASIAAFDRSSGKVAWAAGGAAAGYSSPALLDVAGAKQLVCFDGAGVMALDPVSGTELWAYSFQTPYDCNTATPIAVDGDVFISAGENHGCVLLNVDKQNDAYKVTERWASVDSKSVMRNEWQTSVVVDGYLYGFDNVGSAGPISHLACIEARTGKPVWQKTRFGKGNLVLADGKLWITTMKGELVLAAASPKAYEELGRAKLFGKTRQALSISNGHGFIRDDAEVLCIKLTK